MLDYKKTHPQISDTELGKKFEEFSPVDSDLIAKRVLQLQLQISGITFGLFFAAVLFLSTIWLLIKGGKNVGMNLSLLHYYLPGYSVTWIGSFLGALYGLFYGYVFGFLVAYIYNKIADFRLGK